MAVATFAYWRRPAAKALEPAEQGRLDHVNDNQLFPLLGALRRRGFPRFVESLVTTMAVGRDQGYLAKPWVRARTIEVDTTSVGILEFDIDDAGEDALYEHGRSETAAFLDKWDFEA